MLSLYNKVSNILEIDNISQFQIIFRELLITILNFFNIDSFFKIDAVDTLEYIHDYSGYVP